MCSGLTEDQGDSLPDVSDPVQSEFNQETSRTENRREQVTVDEERLPDQLQQQQSKKLDDNITKTCWNAPFPLLLQNYAVK